MSVGSINLTVHVAVAPVPPPEIITLGEGIQPVPPLVIVISKILPSWILNVKAAPPPSGWVNAFGESETDVVLGSDSDSSGVPSFSTTTGLYPDPMFVIHTLSISPNSFTVHSAVASAPSPRMFNNGAGVYPEPPASAALATVRLMSTPPSLTL